jgi:hypothetical protein
MKTSSRRLKPDPCQTHQHKTDRLIQTAHSYSQADGHWLLYYGVDNDNIIQKQNLEIFTYLNKKVFC